jgi:hypothetical protein
MKVTNKNRNKCVPQPPVYLMGKGSSTPEEIPHPVPPTITQTVITLLCFALLMFVLFT